MNGLVLTLLGLATLAQAGIIGALLFRHSRPPSGCGHFMGREFPMPVSQDVQDYCAALKGRVQAATAAAVKTALAQVTQDHADEMAALGAALDEAAPAIPADAGA
jgi:hypothetical protein